ncbi:MAG: energy-coupling factor transporter ATPase [Clostridia bacterium]|nr:energy-coupling factor transporter ATPase [Clostridia bacterium]
MALLEAQKLEYIYSQKTPFVKQAVKGVDFCVEKGEIVGIIGHTGSGKSTLVQMLNGLLKPTSGSVTLNGEDIFANKKSLHDARFKIGLVFQYPEYQLFDETVYKDISFGPSNMGLEKDEIDRRVISASKLVGLPPHLLNKSPFDLSGGEKRRAAIAGVVAMEPEILILDEPTAGLDPKGRQRILDMIVELNKTTNTSVVIVSHNMEDIAKLCNKVLVLKGGEAVAFDTPEKIFAETDIVEQSGLILPALTKMLISLKNKGLPVNIANFSVNDAVKELIRLKKEGYKLDA